MLMTFIVYVGHVKHKRTARGYHRLPLAETHAGLIGVAIQARHTSNHGHPELHIGREEIVADTSLNLFMELVRAVERG
jgi:hypothetical protein